MTTKDGWTIRTVEPDGPYAGEALGKVWLKDPRRRVNVSLWYTFADVALAETAALLAQDMTKAEFDAWYSEV